MTPYLISQSPAEPVAKKKFFFKEKDFFSTFLGHEFQFKGEIVEVPSKSPGHGLEAVD